MAAPEREIEHVEAEKIRELFNKSQYPELIRTGQLRPKLRRKSHLKNLQFLQDLGAPYCTHTELWEYADLTNTWKVICHCYRMPNGTLAASGLLDPKFLKFGHRIYKEKP